MSPAQKALRERILAICRAEPELKAAQVAERFRISNNMARVYVLEARRERERQAAAP